MKTVKAIRILLTDKSDEEIVFMPFFDKTQADEWLLDNAEPILSNDEWSSIVSGMENDDALWRDLIESWNWHINKALQRRKKGNNGNH